MVKPPPTVAHPSRPWRGEALSDGPARDDAGDLRTLLRLWSAVGDIQARRRILSLARQEARRAGYAEET